MWTQNLSMTKRRKKNGHGAPRGRDRVCGCVGFGTIAIPIPQAQKVFLKIMKMHRVLGIGLVCRSERTIVESIEKRDEFRRVKKKKKREIMHKWNAYRGEANRYGVSTNTTRRGHPFYFARVFVSLSRIAFGFSWSLFLFHSRTKFLCMAIVMCMCVWMRGPERLKGSANAVEV